MQKYPEYASKTVINWFVRHTLGLLRLLYQSRPGDIGASVTDVVESIPYLDLDPEQLYVAQRTAAAALMSVDHFDMWACGHLPLQYIYPVYRKDVVHSSGHIFGFKMERGRYANIIRDVNNPNHEWNFNSYQSTIFGAKRTPEPSTLLDEINRQVDGAKIFAAMERFCDMKRAEILVPRVDAISIFTPQLRKASRAVFNKFLHTFIGTPFTQWRHAQRHRQFPGLTLLWNQLGASDAAILGPLEYYYLRRLFYSMLLTTLMVEAWRDGVLEEGRLPAPDSMIWGRLDGSLNYEFHFTEPEISNSVRGTSPAHPVWFQREGEERKPQWDFVATKAAVEITKVKKSRASGVELKLFEKRLGEDQFNWYLFRLNKMISMYEPMPVESKIVMLKNEARWRRRQKKKNRETRA